MFHYIVVNSEYQFRHEINYVWYDLNMERSIDQFYRSLGYGSYQDKIEAYSRGYDLFCYMKDNGIPFNAIYIMSVNGRGDITSMMDKTDVYYCKYQKGDYYEIEINR